MRARLGILLLAAGALATGCNAAANSPGATDGDGPSLVLVTPNLVGVNDFLELAVDGIKDAASQEKGTQKVYASTDPASIQQNAAATSRPAPRAVSQRLPRRVP